MSASRPSASGFGSLTARQRITQVVEGWSLTEPLLFAAWTMHDVVEMPGLQTIRVGRGVVEFNPQFIASLKREELKSILSMEAMRILLGHPYVRQQPDAELSYLASNLTIQECLRTPLPIPRPRELFDDDSFDHQYLEYYYRELEQRRSEEPGDQADASDEKTEDTDEAETEPFSAQEPVSDSNRDGDPEQGDSTSEYSETGPEAEDGTSDGEDSTSPSPETGGNATQEHGEGDAAGEQNASRSSGNTPAQPYCDAAQVGTENTAHWQEDDLRRDEILTAVREASENEGWGTMGGAAREQLKATLRPRLDYRRVLSSFRHSVLSVRRRLTRMKPSRRYGFEQMGSRYDMTTRLLFAVDVSGSMGSEDLELGFSVVRQFFRYGIESVDVLWFDEEIQGEPISLKRARGNYDITGRGGTSFQPVIDYIDRHQDYDGLIVFTDGFAPVPSRPANRRTRILWLFKDELTYTGMHKQLRRLGPSAFLRRGRDSRTV